MYSEFLLKDVQRAEPNNHAFHHYWIHLKEHCCPEEAVKSADILTSLAPSSGHIVHMPGHIYNRVGNYKKAHDAFVAAFKTDSTYMKKEGIEEGKKEDAIKMISMGIDIRMICEITGLSAETIQNIG